MSNNKNDEVVDLKTPCLSSTWSNWIQLWTIEIPSFRNVFVFVATKVDMRSHWFSSHPMRSIFMQFSWKIFPSPCLLCQLCVTDQLSESKRRPKHIFFRLQRTKKWSINAWIHVVLWIFNGEKLGFEPRIFRLRTLYYTTTVFT